MKLAFNGRQYVFSLFGITFWVINVFPKTGWFRLFGKGIKWKHEDVGLLFSERNGYTKYIKIGKWIFSYLNRS